MNRTVVMTFSGGELSSMAHRWPSKFPISAVNPNNGQTYKWKGSFGMNPIFLEFQGDVAYLIALAGRCDAEIDQHSLEGLPYVFLAKNANGPWVTLPPGRFPKAFAVPNLSWNFPYFRDDEKRQLSQERIQQLNRGHSIRSNGLLQIPIPRTLKEWRYKYKTEAGYEGC